MASYASWLSVVRGIESDTYMPVSVEKPPPYSSSFEGSPRIKATLLLDTYTLTG